jgi:hypothetical protein
MQLFRTLRLTAVATVLLAALSAPAALASPAIYVTAAPNPVKAGATVTYTVAADAVNGASTATVRDNTVPIAGCVNLPVVDEAASCTVSAPATPGWHMITAGLTTGMNTSYSNGYVLTVQAPTTTTVTAAPKLADPAQAMQYAATVSPRPLVQLTSIDDPQAQSCGDGCGIPETVDFSVDGVAVEACADRPVDYDTGVATCDGIAPTVGGAHVVTASYSGEETLAPSEGQDSFAVRAPAASLSAGALDFGTVTLGANSSRSVTLTNSGTRDLHVGAIAAGGPYAITSNGCAGITLTPGASCTIALAYAPAAAGASAASLTVDTDAGAQAVALTGTGVAATVITTPPTAPTGAKFAPNESTTLSVSKSDAGSSSVTVPVRCPTGVACTLDGTVIIATSDLAKAAAHSSAAKVQTVARFSGVRVAAGKVKEIKLKLSPAFIKSAQRRGVRLIRATLTINTTFTDGTKATSKQRVKIRIPKAVVKQAAAKRALAPKFTG